MSRAVGIALAMGLMALAQGVAAHDPVYRCGSEGRSYSQQPCAEGTAVDVADVRSTSQVTQAREVARLDARLADALARQRQQIESAAARQGPVLIGPSRVAHDATGCRTGSACARTERSQHNKRQKDRVMLYRAPVSP